MDGEDGYSTDESKRKADDRGDVIFKQSKKTHRSPHKTAEENKLDQLIDMVKEIKTDQIFIKEEIQQLRNEQKLFNEIVNQLKEENKELKEQNQKIRREYQEIKTEWEEMKNTIEIIDREKRKNNIIKR
ncbi:hypothetical protein QE152_g22540 [Popillia japonica]|uniref:Uncharacterized protein n=1 Tax=Popillia japonica TaxID=7064 RepID=A0AAW1KKR8_POPJA